VGLQSRRRRKYWPQQKADLMADYKIAKQAKEDLIRIHNYGVYKFGMTQADQYFENFFTHFEIISKNPESFEAVDYIRPGYRRCRCGADSIYYRVKEGIVEIIAIVGRQETNLVFN
jgi:toxin ParE1/3/4